MNAARRHDPGLAPPTDVAHFRATLAHFATGVTIVTTQTPDGGPVGLTVSSFNSLSLDPPLILWSLSRRSASLEAFRAARHFAVSVLAADQQALARRFSSRVRDRFDGVATQTGADGALLIDGAVAWFECRRHAELEMGDHWLFVGEVLYCSSAGGEPLIYRGGEFAASAVAPVLRPT